MFKEKILNLAQNNTLTNKEIAQRLGCSTRTVRRYAGSEQKRGVVKYKEFPNILILDIETAPTVVYTWDLYPKQIAYNNIIEPSFIICWSAKWLFDSEIFGSCISPIQAIARNDKKIIEHLWYVLGAADIVVAHNGINFDIRKINTAFAKYNMVPPSPFKIIDTYRVAKRVFNVESHSLGYLCRLFKLPSKQETSFSMWKKCMLGDGAALRDMFKYNQSDVLILEELYLKLRPWISNHPNIGLFTDNFVDTCPVCGSNKLKWKGHYYTPAGKYKSFRCKNCGSIGRSRFADIDKEERKKLYLSVIR